SVVICNCKLKVAKCHRLVQTKRCKDLIFAPADPVKRVGNNGLALPESIGRCGIKRSDAQIQCSSNRIYRRLFFCPTPEPSANSPGAEGQGGDLYIRISKLF